jgi:hypothetical protein
MAPRVLTYFYYINSIQKLTHKARRTGADCTVISSLALGVLAAGVVAGRPAVEVEAGAVQRTLTVVYALSCTHSSFISYK